MEANRSIVDHPAFRACVDRVPPDARVSWDAIVAAASDVPRNERGRASSLVRALETIRSNATFHYYQTRGLVKGYNAFVEQRGTDGKAYVSLGRTLSSSRFYFADAAVERVVQETLSQHGLKLLHMTTIHADNVNRALRMLVEAYLRNRGLLSFNASESGRRSMGLPRRRRAKAPRR